MSIPHEFREGAMPRTLALTFGANRLYLVGRSAAPLWIRQMGPWKRVLPVAWHRLNEAPGRWWVAQQGDHLVVLGQGQRPALLIARAGSTWQGMIPDGRQSTVVTLPNHPGRYEVSVLGLGHVRRSS